VSEALSSPELRILLLDTKRRNPNHYICLAIYEALRKTAGVELVVKAELHNAISKAIQNQCNLFFAFDGEELERSICARVAAVCGRSVLWVTEDPYEIKCNITNAPIFDLVFTNDSASVAAYGDRGRHLALAGAVPFHYLHVRESAEALRYDVFFAGTAWPNRVKLLREVLQTDWEGKAIKAKIALPSNEHLPAVNLGLPFSQLNWRTAPVDFARFANASLSTLVLPRVFSSSGDRDFAETPPPRLFEAALAGTVQIVQSKIAETEKYFEADKDFLYFDAASDLTQKITRLRSDLDWRNQIAFNAQAKAKARHCYEHRMAFVLQELRALKAPNRQSVLVPLAPAARPKILFVVHNVVGNGPFGGVEVYLKYICEALAGEYEAYFYLSNPHSHPNSAVVIDSHGNELQTYRFSRAVSPWQLSCDEREKSFAKALSQFEIALVHFHHFIGHVPSLIEIAEALGVATVMTFHDHYAICHNFTLLSMHGNYCAPDEISVSQCDVCLAHTHQILPGSQSARRAYWDRALRVLGALVFNTAGIYKLNANIFPAIASHNNSVILPVPLISTAQLNKRNIVGSGPLKIAVLGNFSFHKGANVIAKVIPLFSGDNVEFHIFGRARVEYDWLKKGKFPYVHFHGAYKPEALPNEISSCHVSLHLSIWPETYCLTLSEAWSCGLVPIVSDIGALGERVTDGVNGLKIPPNAEGALEQAIRRLAETPKLLGALRENIPSAPIARTHEHVVGLSAIYKSLISKRRSVAEAGKLVSPITLEMLQLPLVENWASLSVSGKRAKGRRTRGRFSQLVAIGMQHLQEYGWAPTLRRSIRYATGRRGS
jgi:glycosyltransferase involved in cell wall biosynthesis